MEMLDGSIEALFQFQLIEGWKVGGVQHPRKQQDVSVGGEVQFFHPSLTLSGPHHNFHHHSVLHSIQPYSTTLGSY